VPVHRQHFYIPHKKKLSKVRSGDRGGHVIQSTYHCIPCYAEIVRNYLHWEYNEEYNGLDDVDPSYSPHDLLILFYPTSFYGNRYIKNVVYEQASTTRENMMDRI